MATAGVAHAQEGPAAPLVSDREVTRAAVPWYERFTTSTGVTESITGVGESDRAVPPSWTLSGRWNLTVDVHQAQRVERGQDHVAPEQTSVGAYYQFTPRVRVGGEVSIENRNTLTGQSAANTPAEPAAGVKLESAFRF